MPRQNSIVIKATSSVDPEDQQADAKLFEEIGRLVAAEGPDYEALAELLNRPSKTIQATLRKERRKLALALLPSVSKNIISYTGRYYSLLDRAVEALEYRWGHDTAIATMKMEDILATIKTIGGEIRQVQANVAWSTPQEIQLESKQTFDPANVVEVLSRLSEVRHQATVAQQSGPEADDAEFEDASPLELSDGLTHSNTE